MDKIDLIPLGHSDMGLEWSKYFKGSISTARGSGNINMKYSSIPYFVLNLAKTVDKLDFLGKKSIEEIMKNDRVSFAASGYKGVGEVIDRFYEDVEPYWKGSYISNGGEKKIISEDYLENGRERYELKPLIKKLEEVELNPDDFEFVGFVLGSVEHPKHINILSSRGENYISQVWGPSINIVKATEEETKGIIKEIDKWYGQVVTGGIRSLLEK